MAKAKGATIWAAYIEYGEIYFGPITVEKETPLMWFVDGSQLARSRRAIKKGTSGFYATRQDAIAALVKQSHDRINRLEEELAEAKKLDQGFRHILNHQG